SLISLLKLQYKDAVIYRLNLLVYRRRRFSSTTNKPNACGLRFESFSIFRNEYAKMKNMSNLSALGLFKR
ncbi:hypothetical protein, partial [Plebeiibacterium sediminum]